ncbi:hypothetical protein ACIQU5_36690 [Streptomyces sp. NPDC090306]|uniref:hypothetical protein n=1 Tax=Streptomyces sp. NPDC090306 TaxID=3365961 RepID=UPI0037FC1CBF
MARRPATAAGHRQNCPPAPAALPEDRAFAILTTMAVRGDAARTLIESAIHALE